MTDTQQNSDVGVAAAEIEGLRALSQAVTWATAFNTAATRLEAAANRISVAGSGIEIYALSLRQQIREDVNEALDAALSSIRRHGNQRGRTADSSEITREPSDPQPGQQF